MRGETAPALRNGELQLSSRLQDAIQTARDTRYGLHRILTTVRGPGPAEVEPDRKAPDNLEHYVAALMDELNQSVNLIADLETRL